MEILNWQDGLDKVVGTFDIYLGSQWGITYKRWRLIRGKKGHFLSAPSYGVDDGNGKKKWFPYIEMSPEKKHNFETKVMELVKPFLNEQGTPPNDF